MADAAQVKTGYIRGMRGALITVLKKDGSKDPAGEVHWVDPTQAAKVEGVIDEGESDSVRGGDGILGTLTEESKLTGATVTLTNARFDAKLTTIVAGGKLITDTEVTTEIVGWDAPMSDEDSGARLTFMVELFASNFTSSGRKDGYIKVTVPYCSGNIASVDYGDQNWATEEFKFNGAENDTLQIPTTRKEFVKDLPAEATA